MKTLPYWIPDTWKVYSGYHPEYGGTVYQPVCPDLDKFFIEPFVTEDEAIAYLCGIYDAFKHGRKEDGQ